MIEGAALWALVKRFWWVLPIVLLLAWVWRIDSLRAQHLEDLVSCKANHAQFVADVKAKTEEARRLDAAHKAEVEQHQALIMKEKDSEIRSRIAAAVAAVRVRVVSTPVHPGSSRDAAVPLPSGSAASPAGASQEAVVSTADLETCAENTVKAEGWQNWWKSVEAVPR